MLAVSLRSLSKHGTQRSRGSGANRSRRGVLLILVLIVIAILSLAGYGFLEMMWSERKAAYMALKQVQARELAASGVEMAKVFIAQDADVLLQAGGWYNNPGVFRGVQVSDDGGPQGPGRFTFVAPNFEGGMPAGIRYGLENESAKINLNLLLTIDQQNQGAGRTMLLNLPGMTEDIADCIMDWIDSDDDEREFGAESDYYMSQSPPYTTANAVPQTLDELLLVKGVTPSLLFGADANRNGQIDPSEQSLVQNQTGSGSGASGSGSGSSSSSSSSSSGASTVDGEVNLGWSAYLTVNSAEANVQSDGTPKVNLNQSNLQQLYSQLQDILDADQAAFIILYEQNGPASGTPPSGQATATPSSVQLNLTTPATTQLKSVLDLIGATVQVQVPNQSGQGTTPKSVPSPFSSDTGAMASYLPTLMDQTTVSSGTTIPGRININLASQTVLEAIPGMTDEIVQAIMEKRQDDPTNEPPDHQVETWLLTDGVVTLTQMKALEPYITCGGNVFHGQVVGYFDRGGPAARIEVMIDATVQPANVVFWREMSHLGRGFSLSDLSGDQGSGGGMSNAGGGTAPSGK
jgi:type II secretory pathway component PulK